MVDWPTAIDIPRARLSGITDRRASAKTRSQTDSGIASQRRRFTTAVRDINIPIVLTEDERAIFDAFYITDLQEGVLPFNWRDPQGDAVVTFRFRSEEGVGWTGSDGGETRKWSGTLELEILP